MIQNSFLNQSIKWVGILGIIVSTAFAIFSYFANPVNALREQMVGVQARLTSVELSLNNQTATINNLTNQLFNVLNKRVTLETIPKP